jgi:hypothetical protein
MRAGSYDLELVAAAIGRMTQWELSLLADYLVAQHEGRAIKLSTFIDFAHQDKNQVAAEEDL